MTIATKNAGMNRAVQMLALTEALLRGLMAATAMADGLVGGGEAAGVSTLLLSLRFSTLPASSCWLVRLVAGSRRLAGAHPCKRRCEPEA